MPYENDTVVKTLNVVVAEGNDNVTGRMRWHDVYADR